MCISLLDDKVTDPATFAFFKGTPCPICCGDLRVKLPPGAKFSEVWTTKMEGMRQFMAAVRKHCEIHKELPIWNAYARQDPEATELSGASIVHQALKCTINETLFSRISVEGLTYDAIVGTMLMRLSGAVQYLRCGVNDYIKLKPKTGKNIIDQHKKDAKAMLNEIIDRVRNFSRRDLLEAAITKYSADQIEGVCNLFFVERYFYKHPPPWFFPPTVAML